MQGFSRKDQKSESGLWLPGKFSTFEKKDNRTTTNPYEGYDFFCVGFAPEVNEQMRMEDKDGNKIEVQLGDRIILSELFEPIIYKEGQHEFLLIHWQDVLGIVRDPNDEIEVVK